jgi:hypothetical protein
MNSKPISESFKSGNEPTGVLKVLAFSYIETLAQRGEVQIREALDADGKPLEPPITIVIFSNTSYESVGKDLQAARVSVGDLESVGAADPGSVGDDKKAS